MSASELERLRQRAKRADLARQSAESLLEAKSLELYEKNRELTSLSNSLEMLVAKRTSEMQRARDEALTALKVKTDFIANMSHELRTPMNGVLGVLSILAEHELSEEQQELVDIASSSGEHLLGVINDILDFSKIEANKIELEFHAINVRDYFKTLCAPFRIDAAQKGIHFSYEVEPDVPHILLIDRLRLTQIISNLLSNAIKFTEYGSVFVSMKCHGEQYRISVADTGIGISDAQIQSVFTAFEQADTSITREFGGTGLGMNITKRLVEKFGGEIDIDSVIGEGTVFHIDLPLQQASQCVQENPKTTTSQANGNGEAQVLLVEDNKTNQFIAKKMLSKYDLSVDLAEHGKLALDACKHQKYDLILMDLQMPVMGGIEATQLIRHGNSLNTDTPIIAMTAHSSLEHVQECLQAGMQGHIPKPIDKALLCKMLEQHVFTKPAQTGIASAPAHNVPNIPDINLSVALDRVSGDWPLLYDLLLNFADEYADIKDQLAAYEAQNALQKAAIVAHRLKGSAGNLGLENIAEIATKMEWDLGTNNLWPSVSELDALHTLVSSLNANLKSVDNPTKEVNETELIVVSPEQLKAKMEQVVVMLNKDLMAVDGLLSDILQYKMTTELRALVNAAKQAMDKFDTQLVKNSIQAAITQIG